MRRPLLDFVLKWHTHTQNNTHYPLGERWLPKSHLFLAKYFCEMCESCSLMFEDFIADKCINMMFIFFASKLFEVVVSAGSKVKHHCWLLLFFLHFYSEVINGNSSNHWTELKEVDHRNEVIHENCLRNIHVVFFSFLLRKNVHEGMYQRYRGINWWNDRSPARLHQPKSPDNCRKKKRVGDERHTHTHTQ